jgi:hypothetical protein
MKIEVHHKNDGTLTHIANVEAPADLDPYTALDYAFRWTNNVGGSWSIKDPDLRSQNPDFNENVEILMPLQRDASGRAWGHRSTSVGDILVTDRERYVVTSVGFQRLQEA